MGDAGRDHNPTPDVLVQITRVDDPVRHLAFLDALAELLAAHVTNELAQEQTDDDHDPSTT